ncbi:hypothetical protein B0A48_15069 [Cryoendolithus antarcticus]|uniref:Uncharacterized protein n=1 Tax=Cryoendolithus antarcticus TaxID=1507870 RepID=A0A1V8SJU6_9PEZI|nr:hypothetical protein B0A48_15069 [Cryoendolithus antarcticus]
MLQTLKWVYTEARDIIAKANQIEIEISSTTWPSSFLVPHWPGVWQLAPPPGVTGIPLVTMTVPVHTQAGPRPPVYIYGQTYEKRTLTVCILIAGALVHHCNVTDMHVLEVWDIWPLWMRRAEKLSISVDRREGVAGSIYHGASPHVYVEQLLLSLGAVAKACQRLHFSHAGTDEYYMGRIHASIMATSAFPGVGKVLDPPLEASTEKRAKQINIASRVFEIIEDMSQILTAASLLCECGVFYPMQVCDVAALPGLLQSLTVNEKLRTARPRWLHGLNLPAVERARRTYIRLSDLLWHHEWYRPEVSSETERSLEELSKFVDDVAEYRGFG